jgi:hypothetical protein
MSMRNIKRGRRGKQQLQRIRGTYTQRVPLPISPLKWRMTRRRMTGNSLRPIGCRLKWFTPLSIGHAALKEIGQVGDQTALIGDEEGAGQDT